MVAVTAANSETGVSAATTKKKMPPSPAATPGEWTADEANCGGGLNIRAVVRGREVIIGHTAEFKHAGETFIDEATAVANARLMAAAPELLEALEDLLKPRAGVGLQYRGKVRENMEAKAERERRARWDKARAALKKAGRL